MIDLFLILSKFLFAVVITLITVGILYEMEEGDSRWRTRPVHAVRSLIVTLVRYWRQGC